MIFDTVRIKNYRSIADSGDVGLGPITVLAGKNNVGKSAFLRSFYAVQADGAPNRTDVRLGATEFEFHLHAVGETRLRPRANMPADFTDVFGLYAGSGMVLSSSTSNRMQNVLSPASNIMPDNLVFPVFAGRRQTSYQQQVRGSASRTITADDNNLVSRVMDLVRSDIPESKRFRDLCENILDIRFDISSDDNFQRISMRVDLYHEILLEAMGSGLSASLNLLISLSCANRNLFLIEEPEADLHPSAVRKICAAIIDASNENQFIISTHSSTVMAALGAAPGAVVLHVTSDGKAPPTSSYRAVDDSVGRMEILRDLGYELADLGLGEGWLIFEESSAERIVREFLIPWFAPGLLGVRTIGGSGASRVGHLFTSFREMLLFSHLEPLYRNKAWAILDGDATGKEVVRKLRAAYENWPSDRFRQLDQPAFEYFYPEQFADRARDAVTTSDDQARRKAKRDLLNEVIAWAHSDRDLARAMFETSSASVISLLREIEAEITAARTRDEHVPAPRSRV